jgi:hypothetical protein
VGTNRWWGGGLLFLKRWYDYMHSEARTVGLYHDIFERETEGENDV